MSKSSVDGRHIRVPTRSAGTRSGVNWTRENSPPTTLRQRRHRQGLGQAGHALDEAVAVGQQAQQHPLDEPVLADDDALDLEERVLEERGGVGAGDGVRRRRPGSAGRGAARLRSRGSPGGVGAACRAGAGLRSSSSGRAVLRVTVAVCDVPAWSTQWTVTRSPGWCDAEGGPEGLAACGPSCRRRSVMTSPPVMPARSAAGAVDRHRRPGRPGRWCRLVPAIWTPRNALPPMCTVSEDWPGDDLVGDLLGRGQRDGVPLGRRPSAGRRRPRRR